MCKNQKVQVYVIKNLSTARISCYLFVETKKYKIYIAENTSTAMIDYCSCIRTKKYEFYDANWVIAYMYSCGIIKLAPFLKISLFFQ